MSPILISLPIALPLLAGALMLALEPRGIALQRGLSLLSVLALMAVTLLLLPMADDGTAAVSVAGNWPPRFGIVLVLDRLSALMLVLTALLAVCAIAYSCSDGDRATPHFHALFQFLLMGLNGAFLTGDVFNLFVWFEVLLIASYGLLLHGASRERLRAGLTYVIFNLAGSTLFLVALALIYGVAGTLNMADLGRVVSQLPNHEMGLIRAAGLLLLLVFAVKAALLPLYFWLPDTYRAAPGAVAAMFAIMTKVGIYSIYRVVSMVFGNEAAASAHFATHLLLPVGLATLLLAAIGALAATDWRRLSAYLVIASAGTLIAAYGLNREVATAAALYYLVQTTLAAALLFLLADMISRARGDAGDSLKRLSGMASPGALAVLGFAAVIASAGLPPLAGFLAKGLLLQAAIGHEQAFWFWAVILVSSLTILVALARAFSHTFWHRKAEVPASAQAISMAQLLPAWLLLSAIVGVSVWAAPVQRYAEHSAAELDTPLVLREQILRSPPLPRPEVAP